jgi:hypothetical protein
MNTFITGILNKIPEREKKYVIQFLTVVAVFFAFSGILQVAEWLWGHGIKQGASFIGVVFMVIASMVSAGFHSLQDAVRSDPAWAIIFVLIFCTLHISDKLSRR